MNWTVLHGDAWGLAQAFDGREKACAVVTSPPYWLARVYDDKAEFGHEASPERYAERLAGLFGELRYWLTDDAAVWLNLGDTYVDGVLQLIPARVALAMGTFGWQLRSEVIFDRENFTPRPSPGRPQRSHEHVFLFSRSSTYFYDDAFMREPAKYAGYRYVRTGKREKDGRLRMDGATTVADTRIMRSVWTGPTGWNGVFKHPALMPKLMAERCVLSITKPGDLVLDPFSGGGTTGVIALQTGRSYVGFERKLAYVESSKKRLASVVPLFAVEA